VGDKKRTSKESKIHKTDNIPRKDTMHDSMGRAVGDAKINTTSQVESFYGTGCIDHAVQAEQAGFELDEIVSIELVSEDQTYGITIEEDHSYISDGVVVMNTIPKHTIWAKGLRSVYIAPPGMVHMNVDYSQGELKIAACIANELGMIKAYQKGIDMHLITGSEVFGITLKKAMAMMKAKDPKIKVIRQGGKAGNFGLIYGMSAKGFQIYAKKSYGVDLTLKQAEDFRIRFFETKPRLLPWHEESKQEARDTLQIRTPLGRLRHLPLINSKDNALRSQQERQSINSPVQGTLSDLGLLAMAILNERYPNLWYYGFTHDALTFYIPEDEIDLWAGRVKEVMENLPLHLFGWKPQLKFTVDVEISPTTLADLVEYPMP